MAFPSSIDSFTNPNGTDLLTSPDHAAQHTNANNAIVTIENNLGTNSGTSVLKHFTAGQFPLRVTGVSAIGTLQQTMVGGTINNPIIGTPAITGGTYTSPNFSAGAITTTAIADSNVTGRKMKIDQALGSSVGAGSYTGGPTTVVAGTLTPNVVSNLIVLVNTNSLGNAPTTSADWTVEFNGTIQGTVCGWEQPGASVGNIHYSMGGVVYIQNAPASAGTVALRISQGGSGTVVVRSASLLVLPFSA